MEDLGKKLGVTLGNGNFHNVSLGQGQEVVAEQAMDTAAGQGHWVVLQVILNSVCTPMLWTFRLWKIKFIIMDHKFALMEMWNVY